MASPFDGHGRKSNRRGRGAKAGVCGEKGVGFMKKENECGTKHIKNGYLYKEM